MVKSADVDFHFPVLGLGDRHFLDHYYNRDQLTRNTKFLWKHGCLDNKEFIDAEGRRWITRSVKCLGRIGPPLLWLLTGLFHRFEYDLEPLSSLSLDEVKDRVCHDLEAAPYNIFAPDEREEATAKLTAVVRAQTSIADIHAVTDPEQPTFFPGYDAMEEARLGLASGALSARRGP